MIPKLQSYPLPSIAELPTSKAKWEPEPAKAALLIHDMQDYFLDFWGENSELVQKLVNQVKLLRTVCKSQGIPVIYTAQPINQKREDRALLTDIWGRGIDNSPDRRSIHKHISPEADDIVIDKWRYSAFQRSNLLDILKSKGINQLIICGVYAHIGILATAMEAFMQDIKVFVVADAVADFNREDHETALKMVAKNCGSVYSLSGLINKVVERDIQRVVKTMLEEDNDDDEWPEDDENLVDYGLDSVKIMAFAGRWQRVHPTIDFVKLAQEPTIAGWKMLLSL